MLQLARRFKRELAQLETRPGLRGSPLAKEVGEYLKQNLGPIAEIGKKLSENRVQELIRTAYTFSDQAEIVRFEVALVRMRQSTGPARFDRPIEVLKTIIPKMQDGSLQKADLVFQLASLTRSKGELAEALRLCREILEQYPIYSRGDEVVFMSAALAEELGDRPGALESHRRLVKEFPGSKFAADAAARVQVLQGP